MIEGANEREMDGAQMSRHSGASSNKAKAKEAMDGGAKQDKSERGD